MKQLSNHEKDHNTKFLSILIRMAIAVGALVFVFRNQDWPELMRLLEQVHWQHFILALIIYCLCQAGIALRWWILLMAQGIHSVSIGSAIRLFYLGLFYNNIMPSSVGGDFLKAWYATKHTDKRVEAVLSVIVDRTIGLFGMLLMAIFAYLFLIETRITTQNTNDQTNLAQTISGHGRFLVWIGGAMLILLILCMAVPPIRQSLIDWVRFVVQRLQEAIHKTGNALVLYCKKPWALLGALGLTVLMQSATIVGFWFFGKDLQIHCALRLYFIVFPISWIMGALPISIGGMGILEGGILFLFTNLADVGVESAGALAISQRFIWMLASIPGGIIHFLGAHLPKSFSFDLEEGSG